MIFPTLRKTRVTAAFTVLELMISAALIAILVVIVVGSVKAVANSRKNVQCINHLRQAGTAMLIYIADSNQTLQSFHGGSNVDEMWSRKLFYGGYLAPTPRTTVEKTILLSQIDAVGSLLRCPTGPIGPTFESQSPEVRDHPRRWGWQTYGLGMYRADIPVVYETVDKKTTASFQIRLAAIGDLSRYILLSDSAGVGPDYYQSFRISRYPGEGGVSLRHGGKANVFFLDGHVRAIDGDEAKELDVPDFAIITPPL